MAHLAPSSSLKAPLIRVISSDGVRPCLKGCGRCSATIPHFPTEPIDHDPMGPARQQPPHGFSLSVWPSGHDGLYGPKLPSASFLIATTRSRRSLAETHRTDVQTRRQVKPRSRIRSRKSHGERDTETGSEIGPVFPLSGSHFGFSAREIDVNSRDSSKSAHEMSVRATR